MKLEVNKYGQVVGYLCDHCKTYNDILSRLCKSCYSPRDTVKSLYSLEITAILERDIILWFNSEASRMDNEKRIELHSKFFAETDNVIKDMSYDQLCKWEEELEVIVIQAKAQMQKSSMKRRDMQAKMTKEERDRLITNPEMSGTDGLLAPKIRKDRQSQADKLAADMAALGMTPDVINSLMAQGIAPGKTAVSEKKVDADKTYEFRHIPEPNLNGVTQETLLSELLADVDLDSTNLEALEHKFSIASVILAKIKGAAMPAKMIALFSRVDELRKAKKKDGNNGGGFDPSSLFS